MRYVSTGTSRFSCISRERFKGFRDEEAFQARSLFALATKAESSLGASVGALFFVAESIGDKGGYRGRDRDSSYVCREGALRCTLGMIAPRRDRTLGLGRLPEDETSEHVQAADREEEEGGYKGEVVNMVGEDCRTDSDIVCERK